MPIALALVSAYIVGSVDFAVLVSRLHGVDIHQEGSGNPGTANVLRTLGRGPAAMVLLGDLLKGVIAASMGMIAAADGDPMGLWAFAAGLAAVVGHCYPIFYRFRGGKGVATTVGVLAFTIPVGALALMIGWLAITGITRTSSIGSLLLTILSVPVAYWQGVRGSALIPLILIVLLVVWRHRGNIARLSRGEERKVTG